MLPYNREDAPRLEAAPADAEAVVLEIDGSFSVIRRARHHSDDEQQQTVAHKEK